ncbi:hypothetical protein FGO68_gene12653 [Halteria grandinella]|uniref:Uncharacterized protein n=1 Tax=Halteria grandinella TaxID=5974 RepID=A0A8J8P2Y3_HALGN|nr:hypothetical protein FGO68_gene12653 [Halteria grandinella]
MCDLLLLLGRKISYNQLLIHTEFLPLKSCNINLNRLNLNFGLNCIFLEPPLHLSTHASLPFLWDNFVLSFFCNFFNYFLILFYLQKYASSGYQNLPLSSSSITITSYMLDASSSQLI